MGSSEGRQPWPREGGGHGRAKEVELAFIFSLVDEMSCTRSRPLFFLVAVEVKERRSGQQGGRRP